MTIKTKLILCFCLIGLIPLLTAGGIAYLNGSQALKAESSTKIKAVQAFQKNQVKNFLERNLNSLEELSKSPIVLDTMDRISNIFGEMTEITEDQLFYAQKQFGAIFLNYQKTNLLDNVFVVMKNGMVIIATQESAVLGKDMNQSQYNNTGLSRCFNGALNGFAVEPFAPDALFGGGLSMFAGVPVMNGDETLGVALFQLSKAPLTKMLQQRTGMGKSGETFLIGPLDTEILLLTDMTTVSPKRGSAGAIMHGEHLQAALAGASGMGTFPDPDGTPSILIYDAFSLKGLNIGCITKISAAEALAPMSGLLRAIGYTAVIFIGLVIVLALVISGSITKPIRSSAKMLKDIAEGEGDLTKQLDFKGKDEVAELARWFNLFIGNLRKMVQQIAQSSHLIDQHASELVDVASKMSGASRHTASRSGNVSQAAEEMNSSLDAIAATMEESTSSTSIVASASEEMNATINQIARQSTDASSISEHAVSQAISIQTLMQTLTESAKEIGNVLETINEISAQINLLALNATIEAARAGEAGKGFAVVANEIKELARLTAEATLGIHEKIESVQNTTTQSTGHIADITDTIKNVNGIITDITESVNQQATATTEIAESISQVSQGIQEVTQNVTQCTMVSGNINGDSNDVTQLAAANSSSSDEVNQNAETLKKMAEDLNKIIGGFKA